MLDSSRQKAQTVYRWTLGVWSLSVAAHLVWYMFRALDARPSSEVYANGFGFQLMAFVLTQLPYWLVLIVVLLLFEFVVFGRRSSAKE